jgi:uncharacterized protein (DUF362 family)
MKPVAHLCDQQGYDPTEIRAKVKRIMEKDGLNVRGKSVILKPSFVYPARPPLNRAVNTQPEFVGGVAHALKDLGAKRVGVGEDCLVGPSEAGFAAMGVMPYIRGAADPVYFQSEERVEVKVADPLVEGAFRMPKTLMDADVFISLPKIKVNMYATVTLSVKNHIGFLLQNDRLTNHHYNIHKKIADLYRTRAPDFVLADAIRAGEAQGPMHAEPTPINAIVGSSNGPAADVVACKLMGYDPTEVEHLVHIHDKGLGPIDLADVEVDGEELIDEKSRRFLRPRTDFGDYHHSMNFILGKKLACPSGCVGMIRGSLDRWWQIKRWKPIKGFTFIMGKPIDEAEIPKDIKKRRTFVIGDCAEPYKHLGTFIPGCPIPPMAITYALAFKGINGPLVSRLRDLAWGSLAHTLRFPLK